jgi:hypothetical protein
MSQLGTAATLHQQMPADEIRQTRAGLQAIVSDDRAARSKFNLREEITDLLKRSPVLERDTHQAGNHIVETDQFGGAVWTFYAKKDFCRVFVVMHADIELALAGDSDLLSDVVAAGGEGQTGAHAASTMPWKEISQ